MLELTGLGSILRGISLLYWLLAFTVIGLAIWKGKTVARKAAWAAAWTVVFGAWPAKVAVEGLQRQGYEREAWAYFKKKCETEAGEKIYKTFSGVKSVLVIKPLPPATEKDLFDQFWYGDPYSASAVSNRAEAGARKLTLDSRSSAGRIRRGLDFIELRNEVGEYIRITRSPSNDRKPSRELVQKPTSEFGVYWEDISTPGDRKFWVAGSRFRVIDLNDNSVVAERIGYYIESGFGSKVGQRRPWLTSRGPGTTCPPVQGDYTDQQFIAKVFEQGSR